ncbi:MAG: hypothetical protein KDA81_14745, partial [Planctomycetaceae bacterium]|nr:hypothetical protein [Planctomycetaceae bacterium]
RAGIRHPGKRKLGRVIRNHEFLAALRAQDVKLTLRPRHLLAGPFRLDPNLIHPDDQFAEESGSC